MKNNILMLILLNVSCFQPEAKFEATINSSSETTHHNESEITTNENESLNYEISLSSMSTYNTTSSSTDYEFLTLETEVLSDSIGTETINESSETTEFDSSETTFVPTTDEAICGNSLLDNLEECDDGNDIDDDDCSNECFKPRLVFLTSDYIGLNNFGGITNADLYCQNDAMRFNIPGTFKAWISDDIESNDPYVRFNSTNYTGWYKLLNDDPVTKGWDGLKETLENSINVTSSGIKDIQTSRVWTATTPDGKRKFNVSTCSNWTLLSDNQTISGNPQAISDHWTDASGVNCNGNSGGGKLYCFQVE